MGHFHIICALMSYGEDIYFFAKWSRIQHLKSLYIEVAVQNQCQSCSFAILEEAVAN